MYRSVKSTKPSDTHAYCMWWPFRRETSVQALYLTGCFEKCFSLPPVICRHAWQDSE